MSEENKEFQTNNIEEHESYIEPEVTAIANESEDAFIISSEIEASSLMDENNDDIDPIIILDRKPKRFRNALSKLTGAKIFALILAFILLLLSAFSIGYFIGASNVDVSVALDERPSGDVLNTSEIYNKVNPSVVGIIIYNNNGKSSMASGVVYSNDGYIVTNDHIYSEIPNAKFKIYTSDGKELDAEYVAGDTRSDLAVLKAKSAILKVAEFGNSNECIVGEGAVAIGRPAGATNASNISKGVICGINVRVKSVKTSYSERFIQTDAAINPGSSGGALCNMYGQVIGITSSKLIGNAYEGVGYAIPTARMKTIVDSLIKNKSVLTRARVGITYSEIDSILSEINNLPKGLYVSSVDEESGFYKYLRKGDVITSVNNNSSATAESVLIAIEDSSPGDKISFTVFRQSTNKTFTVSAPLIADKGTSSYSTKDSEKEDYNINDFDFPDID